MDKQQLLRSIPKMDVLLEDERLAAEYGAPILKEIARDVLQEERKAILHGERKTISKDEIVKTIAERIEERFRPQLRPVINGTGIIVHTNLGRAPLSEAAVDAMAKVARGYSTLEYNVARGRRGSRHQLVTPLLQALTGAEDGLVANNNASALMLALSALAKRKEVIVSRGQLVEIGGSFRIPDICRLSGAKLVEVGTTNRTRISDYENAITERTGALLRVHPSNFRVVGFTESASLDEIASVGKAHGISVIDDLGSGAFSDLSAKTSLPREPLVAESVEAGADVVTFSGDKLLGGPQAGIAVGEALLIQKMRKHPLMRVVRPDKLTFAALDETLRIYLNEKRRKCELPVWRMLEATKEELNAFGAAIVEKTSQILNGHGYTICVADSEAYSGGGSLPEEVLVSRALRIEASGRKLNDLQRALRLLPRPLVGYIKDGAFCCDLRTMLLHSEDEIVGSITEVLDTRDV